MGEMDSASAKAFLRFVQDTPLTDDEVDSHHPLLQHDIVGFPEFLAYMASPEASAMAPPKAHDMSHPISSYFISSSHNTYLTGNQFCSDSSLEPYKNVLLRGCRCVEIDVWDSISSSETSDNSNSGEKGARKSPEKMKKKRKSTSPSWISDTLQKTFSPFSRKSSSHTLLSIFKDPWLVTKPLVTETTTSQVLSAAAVVPTSSPKRQEPQVLHGFTLTKGVAFRDVCETIRDFAFVTSDLPVIVSLEVHAGPKQQEAMVEIMKQTWNGMLVDRECMKGANPDRLPSPGELRRKILIKVKCAPLERNAVDVLAKVEEGQQNSKSEAKKPARRHIIDALSSLSVYTAGYTFKHFSQPEASLPTHLFSLSEASVRTLHRENGSLLFTHNRDFLMRVFPSRRRVNSSNPDPSFFWCQGVQMVVLNWQCWDEGMMLNEGMFAGENGWVLKPKGYRGTLTPTSLVITEGTRVGSPIEIEKEDDKPTRRTLNLTLTIFAGQDIPLPLGEVHSKRFKPFFICDLQLGKPSETVSGGVDKKEGQKPRKNKRRSKTSEGVNPDFGSEEVQFPDISGVIAELSFLKLIVKADGIGRDDLAAFACIRLDRLRVGYRFIYLLDANGRPTKGFLLAKIGMQLL